MDDELSKLIDQTREDLQALIANNRATQHDSQQAQRLRQQLADLQKRLEANREQTG